MWYFFFFDIKFKEGVFVQDQTLTQNKTAASASAEERWGCYESDVTFYRRLQPINKTTGIRHFVVSHYSKVNGAIQALQRPPVCGKLTAYRSREMMMTAVTVHQSASSLAVSLFEDRAGGGKERYQLAGGSEALLFEFQSPDMLRPSCPSFTLLIARGRRVWRCGWWRWGCLRDLHLQTRYLLLFIHTDPRAHIIIAAKNHPYMGYRVL